MHFRGTAISTIGVNAESNFQIRRTAVDFGVPLLTNIKLVTMFADAMAQHKRVSGVYFSFSLFLRILLQVPSCLL